MSRNIFLSYATGDFLEARDQLCNSALKVGFDEARARSFENLDKEFCLDNQEILSQSRGAGYWLWKPQIILQELKKLNPDDVLVYSDAGRYSYYNFKKFPQWLISRTRKNGFQLGPTLGQHGPMSKWVKRDTFVLLEMDKPEIHELPTIQAGWSFWTPCPEAFEFLEKWLSACKDPRVLTDMENTQGLPNLPDFKDHRHDMAVLTLLAYKYNAPFMDYRGTFIEKLLLLRPQSRFAHMLLRRIYDVEITCGKTNIGIMLSLVSCWMDIK